MIWVDENGCLNKIGYSNKGTVTEYNGVNFENCKVPNFEKVKSFVLNAHARIPMCALVGWDIGVDENDEPILVEANLESPSVNVSQLCCGPIFGDRTEEVFDYVKNHYVKKKLLFF